MCGRTSICQKLGLEDSSAWLYWSLCRKSRSNNLKNTSCAALTSQQVDGRVPLWLEAGCPHKLLMWQGPSCSSCMGGGCQMCSPSVCDPSCLPGLLCLHCPVAVYTCLVQTCPQSQLGRCRCGASEEWEEEEEVVVVTAGARGTQAWGTLFSSSF